MVPAKDIVSLSTESTLEAVMGEQDPIEEKSLRSLVSFYFLKGSRALPVSLSNFLWGYS